MEQQQVICVGNLVHLNSGSPDLKVIAVSSKGVEVEWEDRDETKVATFPVACLKLAI